MMLKSRGLAALSLVLGLSFCAPVLAQPAYPDRPVRMIVPFAAGGGTDITGRRFAAKLGAVLGQNVIVDNRGGNDGAIGSAEAARARPDGYTLLMGASSSHAIIPAMEKLSYDPVKDFAPVAVIGITPMVLAVHPEVAGTLQDFVAKARAHPGKYGYGSTGTGGLVHLAGELLQKQAGITITNVPYKGSGPGLQDLMAGHLPSMIATVSTVLAPHRAGKIRILAAFTAKRMASAPDIPTAVEQGFPGVLAYTFNVLLAPAGTAGPVIERLHQATQKVVEDPALKKELEALGIEAVTDSSPAKARQFLTEELARWTSLIQATGLKAN